ncbi:hypothetical protein LINGRAHAP2_LOCUS31429 [Linum grandiflorum]
MNDSDLSDHGKDRLQFIQDYGKEYSTLCQTYGQTMMEPFIINEGRSGTVGPRSMEGGLTTLHLDQYPLRGGDLLYQRELSPNTFFRPSKGKKPVTSSPQPDPTFRQWYKRLRGDMHTTALWGASGISQLLALSSEIPDPDTQLFKAALCFWSTDKNSSLF